MVQAIDSIINFMSSILDKLDQYQFQAFGFPVSILDILVGFLAMSIVIGVFWKGARA